ncbi:MAG: flagellar motor protein MotB [Candidatus Delongbacteria bacterium]|nr:flagellar motor protein MotB [Candidatus Delongbacteria bacterium]MBN2834717.1 flagellar motor protein MotB [Candidatus Delongbacteria bacterium]
MGKKNKCECPSLPGWVTTFGDLMSLLLTFFILLLSFSSIQESKFQDAMGSLQGALGVLSNNSNIDLPTLFNISQEQGAPNISDNVDDFEEAENAAVLMELEEQLSMVLQDSSMNMLNDINPEKEKNKENEKNKSENDNNYSGDSDLELNMSNKDYIDMKVTDRGLHIVINDSILFKPGDATLKDNFKEVLKAFGKVIAKNQSRYNVIVEGHTDNVPIKTARYPSNWDLSGDRALSVVKYMQSVSDIDPAIFSATGYGEYRPIAPNNTREGRAKNRRVEIYLERKIQRKSKEKINLDGEN